jgi:hypothetical protein
MSSNGFLYVRVKTAQKRREFRKFQRGRPIFSEERRKGSVLRIIFSATCMLVCETWSLTLREEHRLRVYENRVLRGIFGPKRDEVRGEWGNYIMRRIMICTADQLLFG